LRMVGKAAGLGPTLSRASGVSSARMSPEASRSLFAAGYLALPYRKKRS
jgi:hypothetical protein